MYKAIRIFFLANLSFVYIHEIHSQRVQNPLSVLDWGETLEHQIDHQDSIIQDFEHLLEIYLDQHLRDFSQRRTTQRRIKNFPSLHESFLVDVPADSSSLFPSLTLYQFQLEKLDSLKNLIGKRKRLPLPTSFDDLAEECMSQIHVLYGIREQIEWRLFQERDRASNNLLANMNNGRLILRMKKETQMVDYLLRMLPKTIGENLDELKKMHSMLKSSLESHRHHSFNYPLQEDQQMAYDAYLWSYDHQLLPTIEAFLTHLENKDVDAINFFFEETYWVQWDYFDYAQVQFDEMAKSRYFLPMIQTSIIPAALPNHFQIESLREIPNGSP